VYLRRRSRPPFDKPYPSPLSTPSGFSPAGWVGLLHDSGKGPVDDGRDDAIPHLFDKGDVGFVLAPEFVFAEENDIAQAIKQAEKSAKE